MSNRVNAAVVGGSAVEWVIVVASEMAFSDPHLLIHPLSKPPPFESGLDLIHF